MDGWLRDSSSARPNLAEIIIIITVIKKETSNHACCARCLPAMRKSCFGQRKHLQLPSTLMTNYGHRSRRCIFPAKRCFRQGRFAALLGPVISPPLATLLFPMKIGADAPKRKNVFVLIPTDFYFTSFYRMLANDMNGLSWLQRQQQKLRERKDSIRRAERHPQEVRLMSELRSNQHFRGQQQLQHQNSRPVDDAGYLSDVTLFSELDMVNTSREGSPDIRSLYATPLHINTAGNYGQYQVIDIFSLFSPRGNASFSLYGIEC